MNKNFLIYLIIGLSSTVYSCNQKNDSTIGCNKSKILPLIFTTNDIVEIYHEDNPANNDRQQYYRSALVDSIDNLTLTMLEFSGGIALDGQGFFNPCYSIDQFYDDFQDYKNNSIRPFYDSLDQNDKESKEFIKKLKTNFFSENPYFDKDYFKSNRINQLTYDLLTLELELVN
ncbi:MAG: hypothetical protein ACNS60_13390 [Candidatus Cyclobacteriaceae bacterium M2_1C_046]